MKKILLIIFFVGVFSFVKAQNVDSLFQKKYIQKINFLTPGISGELLLNPKNSITLNYNIGLKFRSILYKKENYDNSTNYYSIYNICYVISVEARNYINTSKRNLNNKRIDKFSGSYGALKVEAGLCIYSIENSTPYYIEFGPMLGFQKAIGKIWYWDINAGVGPYLYNDLITFNFFSTLKFGIAF